MVTKSLSLEVSSLQASQAIEEHPGSYPGPPSVASSHARGAGRQAEAGKGEIAVYFVAPISG